MEATFLGRAARWVRRRLPTKPRPAILMYHRIDDDTFDPWGVAVSAANFADQLDWLQRYRTPIGLTEFARHHRQGNLPADAVAVTFDDGYACNASTAAPMLNGLGIPATIFIAADLIEKDREIWWDELKRLVLEYPDKIVRLSGEELELGHRSPGDWHWQPQPKRRTPRQHAFYNLWERLRPMSMTDRNAAMVELRRGASASAAGASRYRLMTPEEARSIQSASIRFGSHGLTHARLPGLTPAEKAHEIGESVAACRKLTGVGPEAFAYAYGELDGESEALVEQFGFACGCATGHRLLDQRDSVFALPRIHAWNRDSRWLRQTLAVPAP